MLRKGQNKNKKKQQAAQSQGQLLQTNNERFTTPEPQQTATPAATPATNRYLPIGEGRPIGECAREFFTLEIPKNLWDLESSDDEETYGSEPYESELLKEKNDIIRDLKRKEQETQEALEQAGTWETQVLSLEKKVEAYRIEKEGWLKKSAGLKQQVQELMEKLEKTEKGSKEDWLKVTNRNLELIHQNGMMRREQADGRAELRKEHDHTIAQLKRKVTAAKDAGDKHKEEKEQLRFTLTSVMEAKALLEKDLAEERGKEKMEDQMEVDRGVLSSSTIFSWNYEPVDVVSPPPQSLPPSPPPPIKTYAQVATQTEGVGAREIAVNTLPAATTNNHNTNTSSSLPGCFAFVEDMTGYEKEEKRGRKEAQEPPSFITKAVVIHAIPTHWSLKGLQQTLTERQGIEIMGIRWLLNQQRRQGKKTSSVVVYFPILIAIKDVPMRLGGKKHGVVPYDFDR